MNKIDEKIMNFLDDNKIKYLKNYDFIRIHSGFIVSMSKIKFLKSDTVELKNGTTLKVSRKYVNEVKDRFYKYLRR